MGSRKPAQKPKTGPERGRTNESKKPDMKLPNPPELNFQLIKKIFFSKKKHQKPFLLIVIFFQL